MMQQRMLMSGPLHQRDGELTETGYALSPIKDYDRSRVKASRLFIKEWDYYLVMNQHAALALTIADNGYMSLDSISLLNFADNTQHTQSRISWFPLGKRGLPASSLSGVSRAVGKNYELTFRVEGSKRQLYGNMYDFTAEEPLLFDIELMQPRQDSMAIVTPFPGRGKRFYYNHKINCLPAEGRVILGKKEIIFSPAASFGLLDWGRGVWPYQETWYWGSASGIQGGRAFGLNIGYGFGDTSKATENMLYYGGIAHKLGQVTFAVPKQGNQDNYLLPWQVGDDAGRLSLTFSPVMDRSTRAGFGPLMSDQHQVFGKFDGYAILDDGRRLDIKGLQGFLEKVANRW